MTGSVKLLNSSGHTLVEYDTADEATIREAERIIEQALASHASVFDAKTREKVPTRPSGGIDVSAHEELLVVPQMAGGC
jgi:hypothetical protein